uniref:Uncharacterized protein n=1 Tax=Strombidium rassoulzadegani TaxID=1082188 RepID=A0A7S3CW09_9SPIT|mmetsp:Transcript_8835/g.14977  ORF Transcript_8835/g.14977 Transcript_8835/m.14977 type:complete len:125 (+) Transcript_8835:30-404(+)
MSSVPKPYDKENLKVYDENLKQLVDDSYNLCLYKCGENIYDQVFHCKQGCYKEIIVPYRYALHSARDNEETNYRKCLAHHKSFPNISQKAMMECSYDLFAERALIMQKQYYTEARRLLNNAHTK